MTDDWPELYPDPQSDARAVPVSPAGLAAGTVPNVPSRMTIPARALFRQPVKVGP